MKIAQKIAVYFLLGFQIFFSTSWIVGGNIANAATTTKPTAEAITAAKSKAESSAEAATNARKSADTAVNKSREAKKAADANPTDTTLQATAAEAAKEAASAKAAATTLEDQAKQDGDAATYTEQSSHTDMGILSGEDINQARLRNGDVGFDDIPKVIKGATNFLIGLSGSISVVMIILGAFRMVLGSVQNDKSKGKDGITYGLVGLAVSTGGWFILQLVIEGLFGK